MVPVSGFSKTVFLSSDPDELCDRLKIFLQEKQAHDSDIIIHEIAAIVVKFLEYKSEKQHKQLLIKCNLLYEQV